MSKLLNDLDDLPDELKKELSFNRKPAQRAKRASKRYIAIVELLMKSDAPPTYDELLVHIYRRTEVVLTREKLQQTLHALRQKGWITGKNEGLALCDDSPEVLAIRERLNISTDTGEQHVGTEPEEGKQSQKGKPVSTGKGSVTGRAKDNNTTQKKRSIACANCAAVKTLGADEKHITWKELEFCSFRCKRELVDTLEET